MFLNQAKSSGYVNYPHSVRTITSPLRKRTGGSAKRLGSVASGLLPVWALWPIPVGNIGGVILLKVTVHMLILVDEVNAGRWNCEGRFRCIRVEEVVGVRTPVEKQHNAH
jgi:hypothetical protein